MMTFNNHMASASIIYGFNNYMTFNNHITRNQKFNMHECKRQSHLRQFGGPVVILKYRKKILHHLE